MVNKRGWLRIMEATVAITIFASVLLVVYSQQISIVDKSEPIEILQEKILSEIEMNNNLRSLVLNDDEYKINNYFTYYFPDYLDYYIRICDLTEDVAPCKLHDYSAIYDKEIYVKNTIISGNLTHYEPKFVNVFVWEA